MVREDYSTTQITQNLRDAGCSEETIQAFLEDLEHQELCEGMRLLQRHRKCLLDGMHEWQKKIDCLDYLIYRLRDCLNCDKK